MAKRKTSARKTTTRKKATTARSSASKSSSRKTSAAKKTTSKKKTTPRKPASKKKATTSKKTAGKKKAASKATSRKKTTSKKTPARKKSTGKKSPTKKTSKKSVSKKTKKTTTRKKTTSKKKVAKSSKKKTTKRPATAKKTKKTAAKSVAKKSTTKKKAAGKKTTKKSVAKKSTKKTKKKSTKKKSGRRGSGRSVAEVASTIEADADGYVLINGRRVRMMVRSEVPKTRKRSSAASKAVAAVEEAPKKLTKTPLTRKELNHYKSLLLTKRKELIGDLGAIEQEALRDSDVSHMPIHMADVGTDTYEQDKMLGLAESERQRLRDIDDAFVRMANRTYGICMMTGNPIPKTRLDAKPWAKYTIEAARINEGGLGQYE